MLPVSVSYHRYHTLLQTRPQGLLLDLPKWEGLCPQSPSILVPRPRRLRDEKRAMGTRMWPYMHTGHSLNDSLWVAPVQQLTPLNNSRCASSPLATKSVGVLFHQTSAALSSPPNLLASLPTASNNRRGIYGSVAFPLSVTAVGITCLVKRYALLNAS